MIERPDDLAPKTDNEEQEEEDTQAQSIAEERQGRTSHGEGLQDSTKVKGGIQNEDDVSDLVDHMNQMDTSGQIDMSAYDGEETMDDLENRYGKGQAPDDEFSEDDS